METDRLRLIKKTFGCDTVKKTGLKFSTFKKFIKINRK